MSKPNQATSAIQEIEWGIVEGENTDFEVTFPRAQWVHGEKKASGFMKAGGLFISKEQYPNFTAEGFEPTVLITREGTEIEGFAASNAKLAVIRIKHQWVKDETYQKNTPLAHVLCCVKGNEDLICISLRGPSKALAFQTAFNQHISQNVSVANRTRPAGVKPLEPFALWFPLQASELETITSKDGKSNSAVTYPELVSPDTVDRAYVTTLWVGADNYRKFASYWKDTAAWQKTPIWQQRNGHDDAEADASDTDMVTESQAEMLINLCFAKDQDAVEVAKTYSGGQTEVIRKLSKAEWQQAWNDLKAL